MPRFLALLLPALLAGCVAAAAAADGFAQHDTITLLSGDVLVGELVDVRDGRYWVLLTDGRMVNVEFRAVRKVEMGGRALTPEATADLPLPSWENPAAKKSRVGVGFDLGTHTLGRVRFNVDSAALAHLDVKAGFVFLMSEHASGVGLLSGGELALFGKSPVHLTLSTMAGPAILSSFYPVVTVGAGLAVDPKGPFEVHAGVLGGMVFSSFVWSPELAVSWVW